jgi:hypothetical protein
MSHLRTTIDVVSGVIGVNKPEDTHCYAFLCFLVFFIYMWELRDAERESMVHSVCRATGGI